MLSFIWEKRVVGKVGAGSGSNGREVMRDFQLDRWEWKTTWGKHLLQIYYQRGLIFMWFWNKICKGFFVVFFFSPMWQTCGTKGDVSILNLGKLIPSVIFILDPCSIYRKKNFLFLFCFPYFQGIYNLFDISPDFKINGGHAYILFPGLSYTDRLVKALMELYTCL